MGASAPASSAGTPLGEEPAFELECLFDDVDDPTEVTVFFPRGARTVTEWITADVETAVSVAEMR